MTYRAVGLDTETGLIRRGLLVPPLVCLTTTEAPDHADRVATPRGYLLDALAGLEYLLHLAEDPDADLVLHNAPYDLAVCIAHAQRVWPAVRADRLLRAVFGAVQAGRVIDTRVRERLIRIALGELEYSLVRGVGGAPALRRTPYDLAGLVWRYHRVGLTGKGPTADGQDPWRLRYAELAAVPLHQWPEEAVEYAISDAYWAKEVAEAQLDDYPATLGGYATRGADRRPLGEAREVEAAWTLHLWATWGVRTNGARVAETLEDWTRRAEAGRVVGLARGWVRPNGTRDTKALRAAVVAALGERAPRTPASKTFPEGQIKADEETLTACGGDLAAFATSLTWTLVEQRWAHVLPLGARYALTSRPEALIETGRTSWTGPPWQQPPREGGVRETVEARPGWVLCSVDYDVAELCALAQVCRWAGLGSRLGDAINAGLDPHLDVAAELLGLDYDVALARKAAGDPAVTEARQVAKALNFGLPGGLQAGGFVGYARGMGITLTPERAEELVEWWHRAKPEIRAYFRWVEALLGPDEVVQHPVSLRLRGGVRYTAALNGYFQGLVADGAKYAAVVVTSCAYGAPHPDLLAGRLPGIPAARGAELARVLYGTIRPILFLHDEILSEVLEARATEVAEAKAEVMVAAMRRHTPDQVARAAPTLMRRWSKAAKSKRGADGRLSIWTPPAAPAPEVKHAAP